MKSDEWVPKEFNEANIAAARRYKARAEEAELRVTQLSDALSQMIGWAEDGSPDEGRQFVLEEAREAMAAASSISGHGPGRPGEDDTKSCSQTQDIMGQQVEALHTAGLASK